MTKVCKRHFGYQPGGGVCAGCLEERLIRLFRGETEIFDWDVADKLGETSPANDKSGGPGWRPQSGSAGRTMEVDALDSRSQFTKRGADDAVEKNLVRDLIQPNVNGSTRDWSGRTGSQMGLQAVIGEEEEGEVLANDKSPPQLSSEIKSIMKEWALLQAERRSNRIHVTALVANLSDAFDKYHRPDPSQPSVERNAGAQIVGASLLPKVYTIAEETPLGEKGDDIDQDNARQESVSLASPVKETRAPGTTHLDGDLEDTDPESAEEGDRSPACFNSVWSTPSKDERKAKWVKGFGSPKISSNRIFPRKSREELAPPARMATVPEDSRDNRREGVGALSKATQSVDGDEGWQSPQVRGLRAETATANENVASRFSSIDARCTVEESARSISCHVNQNEVEMEMAKRLENSRNAVISWLQNLPSPKTALFKKTGQLQVPSGWGLSLGGNVEMDQILDEGVEVFSHPQETSDESIEDAVPAEIPSEMSSFRKFLVSPSQKLLKFAGESTTADSSTVERPQTRPIQTNSG